MPGSRVQNKLRSQGVHQHCPRELATLVSLVVVNVDLGKHVNIMVPLGARVQNILRSQGVHGACFQVHQHVPNQLKATKSVTK